MSKIVLLRLKNVQKLTERKEVSKKRKLNKILPFVLLGLALGSVAYADYYLSDGTRVSWAGGDEVYIEKDGVKQKVEATRNEDGRLVPNTGLSNSQQKETDMLGSQATGGDNQFNQNTGLTVPVFTNGQLTGFSNVYEDANGLGRTFYTQNNGAGGSGITVISGQNGGSADFNWSRVDLSAPQANNPPNTYPGDYYGGYYSPPPSPPPAPPTNLLRSSSIEHNSAWEAVRTKNKRSPAEFYAGEKFMVKATTTHDATSVSVTFNFPQATKDISPAFQESPNQNRPNFAATYQLVKQNTYDWSGTFWRKPWVGIPDGTYTAVITTRFQNGQTRTATHSIQIHGSILDFADGIEKIQQ